MKKKIYIILPFKESLNPKVAGAVSIYVKDTTLCSIYKRDIKIFGSTNYKKKLLKNYINLPLEKRIFQSSSKLYVKSFLKDEIKRKSDIIEIHNRPSYVKEIAKQTKT